MIEHRRVVAGEPVTINVVEREEDLDGFRDFIRSNLRVLGVDSETTGLDIYSDDFGCRLVQFGNPSESYVVPVEMGGSFAADVRRALTGVDRLILHNASFDLQVFDRCLGVPMEELWPKVTDTRILAHLVDPRARMEGGSGHSLEELTARYIDEEVAAKVKTLMVDLARQHKTTKAHIWKKVELGNPDYQVYSGMDPILACRLLRALLPLVPVVSEVLVPFELQIAEICSYIERKGFLLDVDYTQRLSDDLAEKERIGTWLAAELGVENVNSTDQVANALEARGVKIKGRTPSGKRKVDKSLLGDLVAQQDDLAIVVQETKKAGKWRKTWVDKFLGERDADDRCHAHINPLQARTARMSITGIPAQTLPAGDWMIRRCFLADPGELIASVDYQSQELRVLAALSGDQTMIRAFENDLDLHQMTADASGVDRKVGKMANFLTVYGGGAGTLQKQANIDFPLAKRVVEGFFKTYPGVKKFNERMAEEAGQNGYIVTPTGRRLPVDENRAYSAANYAIQSMSRDVTCRALVRLHAEGFTPYVRLLVHDEILCSLPQEHAEWGARKVGEVMSEMMGSVEIGTDPEVGGRSWGSLYLKPEDREKTTDPYLLKGT